MHAESLQTLELPKILSRLADQAAFSASKDLAFSLAPTADLAEAGRRQRETSEARLLLSIRGETTIGGAHDVRPAALAAARGAVLDPQVLLDLKSTLLSARALSRFFEKSAEQFPVLAAIAQGLQPAPGLIDAISRILDERGNVLDTASDPLASIRHELRVAHDRLTSKLQRMIADPKVAPMLQESIITQREGRFVIPLRAEFKGRIKAITHDQSSSGATLFIEPVPIVELNNQIRELQLAERDEIRRILAELSAQVGALAPQITATVEALAHLDLAFAKARLAETMQAAEPILTLPQPGANPPHPGTRLRLYSARHPLIDPQTVVPIDLLLDDDVYALVITGPNTGGKTVALKTAGLLALMAACGLHIPALSGSELTLFATVYADIGDEQSIEQSLSTFSSHVTNIVRILAHAGESSLVLLDELGAGTDPQEGAALARAILGQLLDRRVTTLVATHYPELKTYAHETHGVRNASVEFDLETLRPTYHLTIGLPGRSNALAIAERLGLDGAIVERARLMVSPEGLHAESLLDEIHRQRDAAREARTLAEQAQAEVDGLQEALAERLQSIEEERRAALAVARQEAEADLASFREELDRLRRRLTSAGQPLEATKQIAEDVDALADQVAEPIEGSSFADEEARQNFQLGERVQVGAIAAEGIITALTPDQAEVQIGRLRVRSKLDELKRPAQGSGPLNVKRRARAAPVEGASLETSISDSPPLELHLRGMTVDEGLEELERRLDAAYLAGVPFLRVIHGKGSGRLRQAIRQALKGNRYVQSFESGGHAEGGDGVTIVKLANA